MIDVLIEEHKKQALAHLNSISPDTFDEGEFGPWTFTDLEREGAQWTLSFDNSDGDDSVSFDFAGECVGAGGGVADDWFEQVNASILEWESGRAE